MQSRLKSYWELLIQFSLAFTLMSGFPSMENVLNNFVETNKRCLFPFQTVCYNHFLPISYRSNYNSKRNGMFIITLLSMKYCRMQAFYILQSSNSQSLAPDQEHQHHLRPCQKCTFSGPTPKLLIQKLRMRPT